MIKLGRYQTGNIPKMIHFLIQCNKYTFQRQHFFNQINKIIPDIERKSTSEIINLHMNSNDRNVNKIVMKFISTCMNIRDTLLLSNEIDVI